MKKIVHFLAILICCIMMTACNSDSDEHIGEVKTPSGSLEMKGKKYLEVVEIFEEDGFTNIKTEKIEDLVLGWLTEDGEVEEVSVGGDTDYTPDSWVSSDIEVIIKYHTYPEKEKAEVASPVDDNIMESSESIEDEAIPKYTYVDLDKIMYATGGVNVRMLPSTDGEKIGSLSKGQDASVTGRCSETGWYRINYKGETAYVSDNYLSDDKPVIETAAPQPTETPQTVDNTQKEESSHSNSTGNTSSQGSQGQSVTVPTHEENVGNLVWVPTKGGKKYHSKSSCSGMEEPMQVTKETAEANGYTACKRCH